MSRPIACRNLRVQNDTTRTVEIRLTAIAAFSRSLDLGLLEAGSSADSGLLSTVSDYLLEAKTINGSWRKLGRFIGDPKGPIVEFKLTMTR